ncbi:MAG: T9SS type A sorting domain-containing protein, partial [Cyclobacteriaceae bacterium]
ATLNGVELKWLTSDEEGNSHFEVYRGRTSGSFQKIGEVARSEDPQLINEYTFTDTEAEGGVFYYQVKNVDYDGHTDLTEIIRIDLESAQNRYYVYPNPAENPILKVRVPENLGRMPMEIRITNMRGQEVRSITEINEGPVKSLDISDLPPGLYHMRIFQDGQVNHFRVVRR